MNDGGLAVMGCTVSFVALCGVYVYVRESFVYTKALKKEAQQAPRSP